MGNFLRLISCNHTSLKYDESHECSYLIAHFSNFFWLIGHIQGLVIFMATRSRKGTPCASFSFLVFFITWRTNRTDHPQPKKWRRKRRRDRKNEETETLYDLSHPNKGAQPHHLLRILHVLVHDGDGPHLDLVTTTLSPIISRFSSQLRAFSRESSVLSLSL